MLGKRKHKSIFGLILPLLLLPCFAGAQPTDFYGLTESHPLQADSAAGEIRLLAELQPEAFGGGWLKIMANYHALVWKKGRAKGQALLVSYVDDATFHDALAAIGAVPGNNLTQAAWDERKNPRDPAPDTRIEGTPVDMLVWWPGLDTPVPIDSLLRDPGGRGFDLRFGGNKALIPEWRSGCIVCLYSCPGSKVGNHAYTVRDYVNKATHFTVNTALVPEKKTRAVVIFRIRRE